MRRRALIGLALLAALQGAAILIWDRARPSSEEVAERARRVVPGLDRDRIRGIAILRRGDPVELALESGSWWITRPLRARADASAVEALLSAVEFLEIQRAVPSGVSLKQLGLDPPAIRLVLSGAEATELQLGALDPSRQGLYLACANRVAVVEAALLESVDRDLDSLRDRELSPLRASELERVRIASAAGELLLERAGEGRGYTIASGGVQTRARSERAIRITAALASLRATRFSRATGQALPARPELRIAASAAGAAGRKLEVELLGACPGRPRERLLRVVGAELACVEEADLAPILASAASGGIDELRDLRLTDLDEPALRGIQIASRSAALGLLRDGARWRIAAGGPGGFTPPGGAAVKAVPEQGSEADDGEIRSWVASLRATSGRLEAVDPAIASTELGAGRILLEREGRGGTETIELGAPRKGGELPVRCDGLKGALLLVPAEARSLFDADPLRFRSRRVLALPRHEVSSILRESGAAREELIRSPEGGFRSSATSRTVDQDRVLGLLDRLAKLEAVRFASAAERLQTPGVAWRLRLEAGATPSDAGAHASRDLRIELGPELRGGGCLGRVPGVPLFVLGAPDCAALRQPLTSARD